MIDFHSHVLPELDDGAKNVSMSLDMLAESYSQGVTTVVATPHYYMTNEENTAEFIKKRNESHQKLKNAMEKDGRAFPDIVLGCELRIMGGIGDYSALRPLCIENTDYILVEMPYKKWDVNYYDHLYGMILNGMKPIIAHIERFWNNKKEFSNLYSLDVLYQVNAESFLHIPDKKNIATLFEQGAVQLLGSDMHNMTDRKTCMQKAVKKITEGYTDGRINYLMINAERVLENQPINRIFFEKMSFFDKLKL